MKPIHINNAFIYMLFLSLTQAFAQDQNYIDDASLKQIDNRLNFVTNFLTNSKKLAPDHRVVNSGYPLVDVALYPGKYDFRLSRTRGSLPRYIYSAPKDTVDLREFHNIFSEGRAGQPLLDPVGREQIITGRNRINAEFIPIDKLIAIQGKTPFVAAIVSAPDCPICLQLEADLKGAGISYYVAPSALSVENYKFSEDAYCAEKPAEAWQSLMARRPPRVSTVNGCEVPFQTLLNFSFAFYNGPRALPTLPQIVFRDGTVLSGYDSQKDFPVFSDKLKNSIIFN